MAYSGFNIDVLHRYVEKIASQVVSLNGSNTISMGTIEESLAGYYNVKLTNGDTSATVAALSINDNTYKVDDYVYLVKAENDGTTTKYFIVGLVSDIQEDFVNLTDLERFEEDKLATIENTLTGTIIIPRSGDTNDEDTALLEMIKDQGFFVVSGYFTCLAGDGQKVNNYGIKVEVSYEEAGESSQSTYYLDTHYFTGQPFKTENSFQKRLIKLDKTQGLKSISVEFYYDKIGEVNPSNYLKATNVAIAAGILKEITQKLSVKIEAQNDKNYFYKTELAAGDNSVTLVATPYADKQVLSANSIQYYWMIEDAGITKDSSNYLHFVGEGWRCLNTYHEVDAIGTTEKVKVWNNKNNSITFDASDENFAQYVSHVKCAIRYQNVVAVSDALGIINYNNEDFYAKLESNVEPKLLILDTDKVELTCNVDDNNDFTKKSDYKFLYQWQKKVGEEFVPLERYKVEKESAPEGGETGEDESQIETVNAESTETDVPDTEEPEIVFIFNEKDVKLIIKDDGKAEQEHQYEMIQNEGSVIFRCAVEIYKKQTSEEDKEENILIATVISNEVEITSKVSMSTELLQPTYYKYYVSSSDSVLFAKKDVPEFFKTQDKSKFANKNYYIKEKENYVLFEGAAFEDGVDYYEKNDPYGWVGDWVILDPAPAAAEKWIPIEGYIDIYALNVLKNYELGKDQYLYYTYQTKWVEKAIAEENQKDTTEEGEEKQEPQEILLKEEKWALPRLLRGKIGDIELPSETIDKMNAFNDLTGGGKNQGIYLEEIYERTQDIKPKEGKVYYYIDGKIDGKPNYVKFDGEDFLSDEVYYEKEGQKKLYINAEYIKTGALLVGDDVGTAKFYADIDNDEVKIAGFTVAEKSLSSGESGEDDYVYLGSNGLQVGNFLSVSKQGASFTGSIVTKQLDKKVLLSTKIQYGLSDSKTDPPTEWQDSAPPWTNGKHMWQKIISTFSDGSTQESEACIEGAKGESNITLEIRSSTGTSFINQEGETVLYVRALKDNVDITENFNDSKFLWERYSKDGDRDPIWSERGKYIHISGKDVFKKAVYNCILEINEEKEE